jgi:hypothetical protein
MGDNDACGAISPVENAVRNSTQRSDKNVGGVRTPHPGGLYFRVDDDFLGHFVTLPHYFQMI